ncbi:thiamine pyrophosphokinase [Bisporella sp. PMI_857]|nr:thiamine pyrophosphokinase [Bisporella sp. PMI_857]
MVEGYKYPFGYMPESLITQMPWPEGSWKLDNEHRTVTLTGGDSFEQRTEKVAKTLRIWIDSGTVTGLSSWRGEAFPLRAAHGEQVLDMDGSGAGILRFPGGGVHMIGYFNTKDGLRYWIPRCAQTKLSYPGMLDNTVGGSLQSGEDPVECIIREADEEASLSQDFTRQHVKSSRVLSFQMAQWDDGDPGFQAQLMYLYEIELPEGLILKPNDEEVDSFSVMTLDEIKDALAKGEFKLNCAMTWIAYMIRHGYITPENEKNLVEIEARLHHKHKFFVV